MARLLQLFSAHQADYFQNGASPDKVSGTGHFGAIFGDSGSHYASWDGRLPPTYNNANLQVIIHWASLTVTSGGCVWDVAFERLAENGQSLSSSGFSPDLNSVGNPSGTLGALTYTSISFSNAQADGVQASESFRIRVTRDTLSGSDTMIGDAFLLNIGVIEV
jgi:hypothetical protein